MIGLIYDSLQDSPQPGQARRQLDRAWPFLAALFVLSFGAYLATGNFCDRLATDFRGYYAAVQIARQAGISAVYDPQLQAEYQAALILRCPDGTLRPPVLRVMVPYLPVFIPLFLPLSLLQMTNSYLIWSLVNMAVLTIYLRRFSIALTGATNNFKLLQWLFCFPVLANLVLGQVNILLVIILGEFSLAYLRGKSFRSGVWAGLLLLKPHLLILLLPGLAIRKRWRILQGLATAWIVLLAGSLLLAGADGMLAWINVVRSFSMASFYSIPSMMNGRGLAFNLDRLLPGWAAWAVAIAIMIATVVLVLLLWARNPPLEKFPWLMLATLAGAFILSWHANLYLWICLIPFLYVLDIQGEIPAPFLAAWIFGPPAIYLPVYLIRPELAEPVLAMAMLGGNFFLVGYSAKRLGYFLNRAYDWT